VSELETYRSSEEVFTRNELSDERVELNSLSGVLAGCELVKDHSGTDGLGDFDGGVELEDALGVAELGLDGEVEDFDAGGIGAVLDITQVEELAEVDGVDVVANRHE